MTIGINTSPLAGQERGTKLTARLVKDRLDAELVGNVSLRVLPTERPDTWEVQGRGELQLAILVELMRREGFELTVGKPQVVTQEIDGKLHEPMEHMTIDVPEELRRRRHAAARAAQGPHGADGQPRHRLGADGIPRARARADRLPHRVPDRDARHRASCTTSSTATSRGTASCDCGRRGSLVADRRGKVTTFALISLQERGTMFVAPGTEVYEGMIVGENNRAEDMDVNIVREKNLTNIRSSTADELERLTPPAPPSLDEALEFVREDECVEVTPGFIRLRKVELDPHARVKASRARAREAREGVPVG